MVARQMKFRDIQVAEDIGKMAELGWLDVEFTLYGCAYLNFEDGKMYYKVSSQAEDIYSFIETAILKKIYPSNVVTITKRMPVPSGMKELIAQDVKMDLARQIQNMYPKDFFVWLYHFAEQYENDTAADLLWQEVEQLAGKFDEEYLRRFENLVNYAYSCRKISADTYRQLTGWLKEERSNMDDDFVSKDMFEKTLYAIAYEQNDRICYMENVQKEYIYEKAYQFEQQGVFVTPVFDKTFWYNYEYRLADVKKDFKALIREVLDDSYITKIKTLRGEKNSDLQKEFQKILDETYARWGDACADTLKRYAYRWGLI